jgi:phosphatidylglycerol:prolipoprotein diacylglycerol transferase
MIPYFSQPDLRVGPLTIHAFGVLVACAVLVGAEIVRRRAAVQGVSDGAIQRFLSWVLVGGFVGAHLVDRLIYFPRETLADPLSLLRFWESLSSFGGFVGGSLGAALFLRRHTARGSAWLYIDSFAYAFPFGWILGRAGCFVAYDHPGRATTFVLGQAYKDGVVRHNLGLDEAIYTVLIAVLFFVLGRRPSPPGFFLAGGGLSETHRRSLLRPDARTVWLCRVAAGRRRDPGAWPPFRDNEGLTLSTATGSAGTGRRSRQDADEEEPQPGGDHPLAALAQEPLGAGRSMWMPS